MVRETQQHKVKWCASFHLIYFVLLAQSVSAAAPDVLWRTNGHAYVVGSLSFSSDGAFLASAAVRNDPYGRIWRTSDGGLQASINPTRPNEEVFSVAFSPTTNLVAVASASYSGDSECSRVRVVQATDGTSDAAVAMSFIGFGIMRCFLLTEPRLP